MGLTQSQLKTQIEANNAKVDQFAKEQQFIAKQVQAYGQAVAQFTVHQMKGGDSSLSDSSGSLAFEEENNSFQNMFGNSKGPFKPEHHRPHRRRSNRHHQHEEDVPHHVLPKMIFPKFNGNHPKIWIGNCKLYFSIFTVPEKLWVSSATMHMEDNAAKWWQAYKQLHDKITWKSLCQAVQDQFGADDYRTALTKLIALKQSGTVEDYTTQFQALQYDITMHSCNYDDLFFTTHYINGLKDEIRAAVEPQLPPTVARAAIIARIQQKLVD